MVKNLRGLRLEKGISQQKLADELGVTQQAINKYENHAVEPDVYMLGKMAEFFDTSIDYLVGHTSIRHKFGPVSLYDLNEEEADFMDKFRMLTPKERESIRMVMENYLN